MKKILVIRLSSIGDVVLTTPVLRCLKRQVDGCELHLITKRLCGELLRGNPHIDRMIEYDGTKEQQQMLRNEGYDYVVDLHNNHRSRQLRRALGYGLLFGSIKRHQTPSFNIYKKENFGKFMLVLAKKDIMSGRHVVDRYFDAVASLGVVNDGEGLELPFFSNDAIAKKNDRITIGNKYIVIACGAQHETKRIPPEKIALIARGINRQVVLVGDKNDRARMEGVTLSENTVNLCGETTLQESAALIAHADAVVTPDSAMMHVAAAYRRKVIAIWGCTSPRFGFWAYGTEHIDFTVSNISCWPCRRMGTDKCPRGHFKCMMQQEYNSIIDCLKN